MEDPHGSFKSDMPVAFPAIQPTGRSFSGGRWPNTGSRAQDGTRTVRRYGDKPSDATLQLQFANITTAQSDQIRAAYDAAFGSVDSLTLPAIIFKGDAQMLARSTALLALGLKWFFLDEEEPAIQSVVPGIATASCRLRAELRPT